MRALLHLFRQHLPRLWHCERVGLTVIWLLLERVFNVTKVKRNAWDVGNLSSTVPFTGQRVSTRKIFTDAGTFRSFLQISVAMPTEVDYMANLPLALRRHIYRRCSGQLNPVIRWGQMVYLSHQLGFPSLHVHKRLWRDFGNDILLQ